VLTGVKVVEALEVVTALPTRLSNSASVSTSRSRWVPWLSRAAPYERRLARRIIDWSFRQTADSHQSHGRALTELGGQKGPGRVL
jgi:hypothetical protein